MEQQGDETHITTTEASGGVTNHGVRYVLLISLLLAILVLSAVWMTGAYLSAEDDGKPYKIGGAAAETG